MAITIPSYTPAKWVNANAEGTKVPLDADNLNRIDNQVAVLTQAIAELMSGAMDSSAINKAIADAVQKETDARTTAVNDLAGQLNKKANNYTIPFSLADGWSGNGFAAYIGPMVFVTAALTRTGAPVNLKQWSDLLPLLTLNGLQVTPNPMHTWAAANNTGRQAFLVQAKGDTLYLRDPTGNQVLDTGGWLQFCAIYNFVG